jgi:hypothetical protein
MIQAALRRGLARADFLANFLANFLAIVVAIVIATASATFASPCAAAQVEVGDVKLDDAINLGGSPLLLNGAGVRFRAVFKVYVAGLYLGTKAATTDEVLAAKGPKRIAITMLRNIDANELGQLFARGVADNSPRDEMSQLIPGLLRMSQIFSDQKELKTGDGFMIDWLPGTGTVIMIKGERQGAPIREQAFFNALLRIWLGPVPADWKLKDALLGKG